MGFKVDTDDRIEATAYARDSSAAEVLSTLVYLTDDQFVEEMPAIYRDDIYKTYKVTIVIEPA